MKIILDNDRFQKVRQYFYGACFGTLGFILLISSQVLNILTLIEVPLGLLALALGYYCVKIISEELSFHVDMRLVAHEKGPFSLPFGKKGKKIWSFQAIFLARCAMVVAFITYFFFIAYPMSSLVTFFHEIGHVLTALAYNSTIYQVYISPNEGHMYLSTVLFTRESNIISIMGGLGVIIVGNILLAVIHSNTRLPATLHAILIIPIWIVMLDTLLYWMDGSINLTGDIGAILERTPELDPQLFTLTAISFLLSSTALVVLSLGGKIYRQARHAIKEFHMEDTIPELRSNYQIPLN
jgi:hypothetical protein